VRNIAGAVVLLTRQDCDTCARGCHDGTRHACNTSAQLLPPTALTGKPNHTSWVVRCRLGFWL